MKRILLVLILAVIGTAVDATASVVHNFEYTYEGQTLTYTVLDETAKTCSVSKNTVSGSVIIPEKASDGSTEYSVASIGSDAFDGCTGLTEITIPNSVTSIGTYAFFKCTGLTKAEFASIESLCNIYFYNSSANPLSNSHHLYINGEEITDLVIPESVTSIGNYAFTGWTTLTSMTIGENVETIGTDAFKNCKATSLTILTDKLDSWSALPMANLKEVTFGDNVTKIPASAFKNCKGLTAITIGNSVTFIGTDAFYGCSGLTKADFASIESLCNINFGNSYANPLSITHHLYIDGKEITDLVIPESVTSIGNYAFYGGSNLKSVAIGNSVTSIGTNAFYGCSNLTSVTIGNSVTEISSNAFYNCSNLKKVAKPSNVSYTFSGVTVINYDRNNAYADANGFVFTNDDSGLLFAPYTLSDDYTIPETVTSIGTDAFYGCI